jgi:hypothetical protein
MLYSRVPSGKQEFFSRFPRNARRGTLGGSHLSPHREALMQSRREFNSQLLGSLMAFGLVETLFKRDLFADAIKPTIQKWFLELSEIARDLKGKKLTDREFQTKMEDLYKTVDLKALGGLVKLEEIEKKKLPGNGASSVGFDLGKIEGLPSSPGFGKQIFGCGKGRSVVPHGHANMCTGFIVLKGKFHGKHYDRVETNKDHYLIKPTIDREFGPGELSTISDHKDNVHWFRSLTDAGYIFNIHVNDYSESLGSSGRLYLDPDGEKVSGGLIKAPKMSSGQCHKKYG